MEAPDPDLSGSLSGIGLDERGAPAMDEKSTEQTGGSLQEDVRAADSADETEVMDRRTAQATLTGDRRENEEHNGMQRLLLQWERLNRGDAALSDEWLTQPPLADVLSTSARLRSPPDNDARLEQWLQQALSTLNAVSRWELRTAEASAENSSAAHDASVVLRELFDVLYQAERAVHVLETQREGVSVPDARQHRIRTRTWQRCFLTLLSHALPWTIQVDNIVEMRRYLLDFIGRAGLDGDRQSAWCPQLDVPLDDTELDQVALAWQVLLSLARALLALGDVEHALQLLHTADRWVRYLEAECARLSAATTAEPGGRSTAPAATAPDPLPPTAEQLMQQCRSALLFHRGLVLAADEQLSEAVDAFDAATMLFESILDGVRGDETNRPAAAEALLTAPAIGTWAVAALNNGAVCALKMGDAPGAHERLDHALQLWRRCTGPEANDGEAAVTSCEVRLLHKHVRILQQQLPASS
ncbi:hypothetical protein CDCA_CDCA01G0451 [Cyanidium caldarium]|uniref:KIF-binding protein n=1 Tax=Cyanidium caldarium TaxID=2771 RepID=A0AAV9IQF7_CYACA|nr:hypothetical protein CDCA_CDCA01G0451 [Cyanidium caldarium]